MILWFLTSCKIGLSRRFGKSSTSIFMVAICFKWVVGRRKYVSYVESLQWVLTNQSYGYGTLLCNLRISSQNLQHPPERYSLKLKVKIASFWNLRTKIISYTVLKRKRPQFDLIRICICRLKSLMILKHHEDLIIWRVRTFNLLGGEVKPSPMSQICAACQRTLGLRGSRNHRQNWPAISRP